MSFDHLDPAFRRYVSYIDKSRDFYQAHGYKLPYRWATNESAPFIPLGKPLSECTVGVATTSFLFHDDLPAGTEAPSSKAAYTRSSWPPPERMFTDDLSWHKDATHTDDLGTFLPLSILKTMEEEGHIGALAPRFYGVPTEYSRRRTERDAKVIAEWCAEDEIDVMLLVPI